MDDWVSPLKNKKAAAILSIGTITILASMAVAPVLAGIKTAFPHFSDTYIQMVLVIPTVCIIPGCFCCQACCRRYGNKKTLITGLILYFIGGLGAGAVTNFSAMLVFRGILGVGCGIILPLAQKLISDNFSGAFKEKIIGYPVAASCLMGILCSFCIGYIAAIHWRAAFLVYLAAFPVLYLNGKYLPLDIPSPKRKEKEKISKRSILLILAMALANLSFYTFPTYIALFMKSEQIGIDSSSGIVVSILMGAGFFMGINAVHIRNTLKQYTCTAAVLCMGAGYLSMSMTANILVLCLCAILVGGSNTLLYAEIFSNINKEAEQCKSNTALITYTTLSMFVGQTLAVPALEFISSIFSDFSYRFKFEMLGIFLAATACSMFLYLLCRSFTKKNSKNKSSALL